MVYGGTFLESIVDEESYKRYKENEALRVETLSKLSDGLIEIRIYSSLPISDFLGD